MNRPSLFPCLTLPPSWMYDITKLAGAEASTKAKTGNHLLLYRSNASSRPPGGRLTVETSKDIEADKDNKVHLDVDMERVQKDESNRFLQLQVLDGTRRSL